jgi:hypothetical protein
MDLTLLTPQQKVLHQHSLNETREKLQVGLDAIQESWHGIANPVLIDGPNAACSPSPSLPHILSGGNQSKTQNSDAPNQESFLYNPNDPVPSIESDALPEEVFRRLLESMPKHERECRSQTPIYAYGGVVVGY